MKVEETGSEPRIPSLGTGVHWYTIIDRSWPQRICLPLETAEIPVRRLGAMNGQCPMCNAVHMIRDFVVRTCVSSNKHD